MEIDIRNIEDLRQIISIQFPIQLIHTDVVRYDTDIEYSTSACCTV